MLNRLNIRYYLQGGDMMGYKIKEFREKIGMTQEELAEKSGVCRTTIWSMENGKEKNATTTTLLKLAHALGTTVDNIFFTDSV